MKKVLTVAILGAGSRGADSYGKLMNEDPRFKIVALCDIRKTKIDRFQEVFNVPQENCFLDENDFFKTKLADVCVIATQDKDHVRHCLKALELGYDILLEKPITPVLDECYQLIEAQKKYGGKVIVCHVLRYAPLYKKLDEIIDSGKIGRLIDIHAIENVGYWHMSHSFVRGNWRSSKNSTPMIMAKCCHDLDLIQHFAKSRYKHVSSIGGLTFFKKENQPDGASDRCSTCKYKDTCPYSAYRLYIERWKIQGQLENCWPQNVITSTVPLTEEALKKAIEDTYYGQCVFACDNDVVDHQETNILFENGVTANLLMTGFTHECGRRYTFHGTYGEIIFDEINQKLELYVYGEKPEIIPFSVIADVNGGHGGGDAGLVEDLYDVCALNKPATTTLEESLESHIIALKAEEDRLSH